MDTLYIPSESNQNPGYIPQEKRGHGENMSLDDAISHLDDLLNPDQRWDECEDSLKEHIKLRDWLIELKGLRVFLDILNMTKTTEEIKK